MGLLVDIGAKVITEAAKGVAKGAAIGGLVATAGVVEAIDGSVEKRAVKKNEKTLAIPKEFEDSYCISLGRSNTPGVMFKVYSGEGNLYEFVKDPASGNINLIDNNNSVVGIIDQYNSLIINNVSWGSFTDIGKKPGEKWKLPYNGYVVKKVSIDNKRDVENSKKAYEVIGKVRPIMHILSEDNWETCTIRMQKKENALIAALIAFMTAKANNPSIVEKSQSQPLPLKGIFSKK